MTYSGSASSLGTCGPFFDPSKTCDCECPCPCDEKESSENPVRYQNGQLRLSVTDLAVGGFGLPWGHIRQYSNRLLEENGAPASFDTGQGHNWLVAQWPLLSRKSDGTVVASRGPGQVYFFLEHAPDNYVPMYGVHQTLKHDVGAAIYTLAGQDGFEWQFNDFDVSEAPGSLRRVTTPGGGQLQVVAYNGNRIAAVERTAVNENGQTATERFEYVYAQQNGQPSQLVKVTVRRRGNESTPWTDVRRAVYTYYQANDEHGSADDLKTATTQAMIDGKWTDLETHYYRYWQDEAAGKGFQHGLKFVLGPEAFARLEADAQVEDPLLASDSQVAQYADQYFEYDADQRVTRETIAAGSRSYTFAYEDRTDPYFYGYNNWVRKTTETRPDGSQVIVYTNHIGQVLLREFRAGADSWLEHWQYDELDGHQVLHAHPSAIAGYEIQSGSNDLIVTLKENDGLIELREYYTQTDLPSGAVEGELAAEKIKQGAAGTEIVLRRRQYTQHSAGDRTVNSVIKETVYRNEDGTGAIETNYSYTFHPGTAQIQERVTTLPAIPAEQNGSGVSSTRSDVFDEQGNLIWTKDERGYIHRNTYDAATSALIQSIQDVATTLYTDVPNGWMTPNSGGLHLVTDLQHDDQGRVVQELGPKHEVDIDGTATQVRTATWTVYDDANHEIRTAQGYATGTSWDTFALVNPVSITKTDHAGRVIEEIQAVATGSLAVANMQEYLADLNFAQSDYVRWTTNSYDDKGRLEHRRVYHNIPTSGAGSEGANYDQTTFGYDIMSRQNRVTSPGGTITRTVFSSVGWDSVPTAVYIGTNDTGATQSDPTSGDPNNMVLVTEYEHDNGNDGGDGLLTKQTEHVDAFTRRETSFLYDWRGRQTDVDGEEDFYQISVFDNLDRVTRIDRHDTTSSGNLIARSETSYDDLGRVYQTKRYAVDVSTGTVGNSLTDNTWYDESGNVLKEHPAGGEAFTKYQYDSLGRQVKQFIGFDVDELSYAEALDVIGDTIFEQSETDYDDASNVIETRLRRRHHDATGTDELTTPSGSNPKARVSYVAFYSDAIGRQIAVANYGTNGDTALSRSSTVPTRSDDILVTTTEYNDDGEAYKTTDPADKEDRTEFDDVGRVTKQIENYTDGDPTTGGNDEDITVCFTYTADGQQATITAKQKSSSDDQTTKYIYGTSLSDSDIARSDLLRAVIYPDSDDSSTGVPPVFSDGPDEVYDRVEHKYNRQGEVTETKDQNETVHAFSFDKLGRQTHDRVTTLGTDIEGAVRRISTTYEVRGQLEKITSYDNATIGSGSVVNEVLREYNDAGLLDKEYQEHDGAKDANTLYVGYNYDESASGGEFTKGLRPTSIRYPDGRLVHYTYGSSGSDPDNLNRLDAIKDDNSGSPGNTLASYAYLGLGQMVIEDYEEPEVKLDYFGGTSSTYAGFDRFNRVIDQRWYDYGTSEDRDRLKYGYDRANNRTWKENTVSKNLGTPVYLDEFYTHDSVNRLTNMDRGQLNGTQTGISGTPSREEEWTLDPLGNWSNYVQKTSGTTDLDQNRTVNKANEITDITETTGTSWPTPSHDRAGNMSSIPQPGELANDFDLTWDAWSRLVKVEDGATTVAEYVYDGATRRILKDVPGSPDSYQHFFYNSARQVLETRESSTAPVPSSAQYQYIRSPRYIDAAILRDDITADPDEVIYYLGDANFNITTLIDTSGTELERYVYTPYATLTIYNHDWSRTKAASLYGNVYTFSGREWDADAQLYCYRARYYEAKLGRYLSRDPIGYEGSEWNLYEYGNSPLVSTDPSGLASISKLYEKFEKEAERRRGNGLWRDSAQHCWAACYIGITVGVGELAAFIADLEEVIAREGDWVRDIAAQHFGVTCATTVGVVAKIWPSKACDCCCTTWPD